MLESGEYLDFSEDILQRIPFHTLMFVHVLHREHLLTVLLLYNANLYAHIHTQIYIHIYKTHKIYYTNIHTYTHTHRATVK